MGGERRTETKWNVGQEAGRKKKDRAGQGLGKGREGAKVAWWMTRAQPVVHHVTNFVWSTRC